MWTMTLGKNLKQVKSLLGAYDVDIAYVFGSYVSGNFGKNSDLDIAVLFPGESSNQDRFQKRLELIEKLSAILGSDVDVVVMNDVKNLFFKYVIIKEGELIYQRREGLNLDFESGLMSRYFDFEPFLTEYNKNYVKNGLQ